MHLTNAQSMTTVVSGLPQKRLLRDRTGNRGKHVVGIPAYQAHRTDHEYQNDRQHHRIFSDVLGFFLQPQLAK